MVKDSLLTTKNKQKLINKITIAKNVDWKTEISVGEKLKYKTSNQDCQTGIQMKKMFINNILQLHQRYPFCYCTTARSLVLSFLPKFSETYDNSFTLIFFVF